jgi:hypothetical protein
MNGFKMKISPSCDMQSTLAHSYCFLASVIDDLIGGEDSTEEVSDISIQ